MNFEFELFCPNLIFFLELLKSAIAFLQQNQSLSITMPAQKSTTADANKGSLTWTSEMLKKLVDLAKEAFDQGCGRDAGNLNPIGWKLIANGFDKSFSLLKEKTWTATYLTGKLKTKLTELVFNLLSP
jgi:hypothetical protein